MVELTDRQREILLFIIDYQNKNGFSPSIRDICKGVYLSQPSVVRHIDNLMRKGYITYTPRVARSIVVREESRVS